MSWGIYGILVVLGLFIILLIFNPNLSCFGKRLKSPLYPIMRKKKLDKKIDDFGFRLVDEDSKLSDASRRGQSKPPTPDSRAKKTKDYGFRLD